MHRRSAKLVISSLVGFEFTKKAFSSATRTVVSIEVRFFRRLPMVSGVDRGLLRALDPNRLERSKVLKKQKVNAMFEDKTSAKSLAISLPYGENLPYFQIF